jgi:hypothetical protein
MKRVLPLKDRKLTNRLCSWDVASLNWQYHVLMHALATTQVQVAGANDCGRDVLYADESTEDAFGLHSIQVPCCQDKRFHSRCFASLHTSSFRFLIGLESFQEFQNRTKWVHILSPRYQPIVNIIMHQTFFIYFS